MLKGGLVVELRVERARTTKDVDLRLVGATTGLLDRLQRAARLELGDFMDFSVTPDPEHPDITNGGMIYDGRRYRTTCALAGKPYGQPFGLDIAFGDPIVGEPDVVVGDDVLGFAGFEAPALRLYPIETHIAEKVHAYALPLGPGGTRPPRASRSVRRGRLNGERSGEDGIGGGSPRPSRATARAHPLHVLGEQLTAVGGPFRASSATLRAPQAPHHEPGSRGDT